MERDRDERVIDALFWVVIVLLGLTAVSNVVTVLSCTGEAHTSFLVTECYGGRR